MTDTGREVATLGGGCFWCTEAVFDELRGVDRVVSGYMGGPLPNPSYEQVCSGRTGHAEVVQVTFDPAAITFREILEIFFTTHDPTTLNRQGGDEGTQYRSVVFHHDDEQRRVAEEVIRDIADRKLYPGPIVTEVSPATEFYPAESYHQDYYARNPRQGYCQVVIEPKVSKLRKEYTSRLKR
jgi:peptide-methionine (S)-S-oxide reductase